MGGLARLGNGASPRNLELGDDIGLVNAAALVDLTGEPRLAPVFLVNKALSLEAQEPPLHSGIYIACVVQLFRAQTDQVLLCLFKESRTPGLMSKVSCASRLISH